MVWSKIFTTFLIWNASPPRNETIQYNIFYLNTVKVKAHAAYAAYAYAAYADHKGPR